MAISVAHVAGVAVTPFGRQPGRTALDWQATAAVAALADAGLVAPEIDAVICGYATTAGHLMPADLLAERLGARPAIAHGTSAGGATGLVILAQAARLVRAGDARAVLVVGGEDRASGQSGETSTRTLAQVGHAELEVPLGGTVPAYYALLASAHLAARGLSPADLAPLAVQMRAHAATTPGAHLAKPITVDDVLASRPIAEPLRLLDCCPVSDGGAAVVVTAAPAAVAVTGVGEAHRHQHLTEADLADLGALRSADTAFGQAGRSVGDVDVAGVYDSFTVTLAMLLEEIGFCAPGTAGTDAAAGRFARDGALPLNTHGGLLSYGHCGVGGGMAHLVEVVTQLRGAAGARQVPGAPRVGFVHGDGGVMSAHASAVLEVA
ncbi:acetyl-CoA acetyltransferase [Actinomycetospora succinea]|uniref:Acetyl-CoA acetyltransferase n=1 Tax=Actinomycetospora succinea TaxID=663603 RepID=A0A4V3DB12_9PSEU|nr:thiolase family protein [Actinomycetospora succinea]TDQ64788.1 acetyl-CoA acetyltransferase [Actinomycetospora succinea]